METRSLAELKAELKLLDHNTLIDICLRLARFKKVNKELLNYLVIESADESAYIARACEELHRRFEEMPRNSLFLSTKYIRKSLRLAKQYGGYSKDPRTPIELLLHFCAELKACQDYWKGYTAVESLFERQCAKIRKDVRSLHEDLQYDYLNQLSKLLE